MKLTESSKHYENLLYEGLKTPVSEESFHSAMSFSIKEEHISTLKLSSAF